MRPDEVDTHEDWVRTRTAMVGKPTKERLELLRVWLEFGTDTDGNRDLQVLRYMNDLAHEGKIQPVPQVRGERLRTLLHPNTGRPVQVLR